MLVENYEAVQKYYDKLQSRIDAAELLGFDISEYEKNSCTRFQLKKGELLDKKLIIKPPRSKSDNSNIRFTIDCDVWESIKE